MIVHRDCGGLVSSRGPDVLVCLHCKAEILDTILDGTELVEQEQFIPPKIHKEN